MLNPNLLAAQDTRLERYHLSNHGTKRLPRLEIPRILVDVCDNMANNSPSLPTGPQISIPPTFKSLDRLPDEVLQQIIFFLSPEDNLVAISRTSKRLNRLCSEPLLWRYYCQVECNYWDPKHRIRQKYLGEVANVDWKTLYTYRKHINTRTTELLDSILTGQTNRIQKYAEIAEFGYDAKDTLLRHCRVDGDAEDVLARSYYANAVLDHVHRSMALGEWSKMIRGEHVPLERALGSFDLFVLHDQRGDLHEISDLLDDLAAQVRFEYSGFNELSPRNKALRAVAFLRHHNYIGLTAEVSYRDLQNNYIGIALQDPDHPSLPLISVAIFCSLAQRLGIDARCCGIPNHVHAVVFSPSNETLDGRNTTQETPAETMYLDPYRSDEEVPVESLTKMLSDWGIAQSEQGMYLADSSMINVVLRTSRNILATAHEFRRSDGLNTGRPVITLHNKPNADIENAFYSALWSNFMFGRPTPVSHASTQRQFIPLILERFEGLYPMDASLIEQYICPLFSPSVQEHWNLSGSLRVVRAADQTPKQVRVRDSPASRDGVKYKVGQVFRHKRYMYTAVITGWDVECGMSSTWIATNHVDSLKRGRNQSFYHALSASVEDTAIRYVAEENIEIIEPEMPVSLMGVAGRFFKRWDKERRVFISNIRDEYPED